MQTDFLHQALEFLSQRSVDAYLVGGYVRDLLLGQASKDIDIAATGDAIALARDFAHHIGGHFVLLDADNKIARIVSASHQEYIDLSTLRGDLDRDLAARDFTINAMAIAPARPGSRVIDPYGGQRDLRSHMVRAVNERVFRDDPVRLVRAVRFAAQLGFAIEPGTAAAIKRDASLLNRVAGERVRDEFARILAAPGAWRNLRLLDELGLLSMIFPELDALRAVPQPPEHYYDVFTHTLAVADGVEDTLIACRLIDAAKRPPGASHPPLPQAVLGAVADDVRPHMVETVSAERTRLVSLKLGALFHDIAKPVTRTVDEDGAVHFYNHPVEGIAIAEEALRRLRFSVREIRIVSTLILNHMRPAQLAAEPEVTAKAVYRFFRDTGSDGIDTLLLSLADHLGTRGPRLNTSAWWQHAQFTRLMLEFYFAEPDKTAALPKLINGNDLIREFAMPSGPRLGEILEQVREAQVTGQVRSREQALEFVRQLLAETK